MTEKAFGSGYFGEWIEDEFGLPAYHYTCDQINDPKAITPMNEVWRSKTDHIHQIGNDRLVGIASNYGHIQVRQDEGSPKFLNEFDPINGHYAGGFGYLIEGEDFITTFYPGKGDKFDRVFGVGYLRKTVTGRKLIADQIVFAPFGDDPVLISQITIKNNRERAVDLRWVEYWGCQTYQFSPDAYLIAMRDKNVSLARKYRRKFSERFNHEFEIINDGIGLLERSNFNDQPRKNNTTSPKAVMKDMNPPRTFIVSLDSKADGISTSETNFFGKGGALYPDKIKIPMKIDIADIKTGDSMILERKIHLDSNESKNIYFIYGYLPQGFELESLLNKYKKNYSHLFRNSCEQWKESCIGLSIPEVPWVKRELLWHYYYLRGSMTYDEYFKEHILSQGQVYQYIIGFQGALRDPMQHVMPFIFSEPKYVKEIIRYVLKTTNSDGEIPYGITGHGLILPAPYKPSDQEMWLLWLTSEYILATRDIEFLNEIVKIYPVYGRNVISNRVIDVLLTCYNHFTDFLGSGSHGLQRISNGDWNDGVVLGHISKEKHDEIVKNGESVLNAAMASYTLKIFGEMLNFIGDNENSKKVLRYAENQRKSVQAQWNGEWFKRAWLTKDIGWIGEDKLWLEPQPWAIIGGAADDKQTHALVESIDRLLRAPSKIGAKLMSKGIESMDRELGMRVNGGIWPSINGTLIWALSLIDGNMAWDEWKKNSLAYHAESFPDVWYGIWSGPDVYNSDLSKYPGQTHFTEELVSWKKKENEPIHDSTFAVNWTDFPVLDLHPHAWPLFNTLHLIGAKFSIDGLDLTPILPFDEYEFSSTILEFKKSKTQYSGFYAPLAEGTWKITLKLSEKDIKRIKYIEVNEEKSNLILKEDKIVLIGESKRNKPLSWKILMES